MNRQKLREEKQNRNRDQREEETMEKSTYQQRQYQEEGKTLGDDIELDDSWPETNRSKTI